ncbi:putative phosphatidylinositol transporter protein [Lasiosphaeria miniovina]|uniref:Phosphatidylinositol transporter protein n=1 Tax=Lasiosphaeria miniovina TaxID=1954250 RepID=A0AA40DTV1_9PEZI|nr:putative phosphatidylinositol transporter protein [Lasiosphaeria miniovina]KAK0713137.1 putative phosphatidylinositol transporter protein [Lasiosphaeria miniovina]
MSADIAPGRPGNLTPEQEEKLRQLWQLIFQVCGISTSPEENNAETEASLAPAESEKSHATTDDKKTKKSRLSIFSRKSKKEADPEPAVPNATSVVLTSTKNGEEDKYGQTKHFYDTLASQSPESIRSTTWGMVKHDHPDALVLRFLRARKWDVEKALVMFISTMNWRAQDMKVDEDIMKNGEWAALEAEQSGDAATKKLGHDFLSQIRMGKSYVHGVDKLGRPICVVRVRLHKQGEQAEESLERYTVYLIETCRMLLQPPVDTATIVFDMTGFSLANMDYTPVKFMVKCFEANYPESLGVVLVHKAPWLFQGIWKVIKGWLDPVVANKVHFTNNVREMEEFVPVNHIPKELDGAEDWEYSYVEPIAGENDKMKDVETRDRLLTERELLVKDYEEATRQWIQHAEGEKGAEIKARRNDIAAKLRESHWVLDPYIRARSYYDRTHVIQPGGKLNYYPTENKETTNGEAATPTTPTVAVPVASAPAAAAPPETSADDVD